MSSETAMLALDCHVHLYQFTDLARLLRAVAANGLKACGHIGKAALNGGGKSILPTLVLTEPNSRDSYARLLRVGTEGKSIDGWRLRPGGDCPGGDCLSVFAEHDDGTLILIISGQQVVTAERLEVLAIACRPDIQDGQSLADTLKEIHGRGAFPVFPWGVGKWLGRRGRLLAAMIAQASLSDFALADTISRPAFWPEPRLAAANAKGLPVLRGTDPLPVAGQVEKAGAFGSLITMAFDSEQPAASLLTALRGGSVGISPFGRPDSCRAFFRTQLALRTRR